jgi:hypothetical protein
MQYLSKESLSKVWETKGVAEIAAQFGVRKQAIYYWGRKWGLPPRAEPLGPQPVDPTEKEIEERAREVREKWTAQDRKKRQVGGGRKRWKPPVIEIGEIEAPSFSRI